MFVLSNTISFQNVFCVVGGDFLTVDWGETFHMRGERIFSSPGDILGGRKYHGTPASNQEVPQLLQLAVG